MTKAETNPSAEPKPVVVVHFDENGDINYLNTAGSILLIVDERAPDDRVYAYGHNSRPEEIAKLIGDSPIGHSGDGCLSDAEVQSIMARLWLGEGKKMSVIEGDRSKQ